MIDLSQEKLVPLRTMFKRRDGKKAVYLSNEVTSHRVVSEDGIAYYVTNEGLYSSRDRRDEDVVAIARPWVPKNGDRVTILGYMMDGDGDAYEADEGRQYFINDTASESNPITIRDNRDNHYDALRNQLRLYVAPEALEEPPTSEE